MRPAFAWLAFTSALVAAPPEVTVVRPVEREVTDFAWLHGRTEPGTTVEIRPRVTGLLEKAFFEEGAKVKKGDILFQLDDRLQRVELARVEAEHARAEAQIRRAELEHQRLARLVGLKAAEREEVEKAAAAVGVSKAELMAARAGLELAKLKLDQTRIQSPIDGRIGRALVDAGNLVKADGGPLALVVSVHPLRVAFDVDDGTRVRLARRMREAGRGEKLPVAVGLGEEDGNPHQAALDGIDHRPDPKAGTFRARATLANSKGELLAGVFARVRVAVGPRKAMFIPEKAFLDTFRAMVFVLTDKHVLEAKDVQPGDRVGDLVEVRGLNADDRVVADPRGRKAGETVVPREEKDSPGPKPAREPAAVRPRPVPEIPGTGPGIVVSASYPGASAHVVAETVAAPIEKQLEGLEGLTNLVRVCTDDGQMRLTALLKKGTDLDKALAQARERIARAEPTLPEDVRRVGITLKKRPVYMLAVAVQSPKEAHDLEFLTRYAHARLRDELGRVPGVAEVTPLGDAAPREQVHLRIDTAKLAAMGLTATDLTEALRGQGLSGAYTEGRVPTITIGGRVPDPDQLGRLVVKTSKDGRQVPLGTVARIDAFSAWGTVLGLDGKQAVFLLVHRTPGADDRATARAVRTRLDEMARHLPIGVECTVVEDP